MSDRSPATFIEELEHVGHQALIDQGRMVMPTLAQSVELKRRGLALAPVDPDAELEHTVRYALPKGWVHERGTNWPIWSVILDDTGSWVARMLYKWVPGRCGLSQHQLSVEGVDE